jgi:hypothetical protein
MPDRLRALTIRRARQARAWCSRPDGLRARASPRERVRLGGETRDARPQTISVLGRAGRRKAWSWRSWASEAGGPGDRAHGDVSRESRSQLGRPARHTVRELSRARGEGTRAQTISVPRRAWKSRSDLIETVRGASTNYLILGCQIRNNPIGKHL